MKKRLPALQHLKRVHSPQVMKILFDSVFISCGKITILQCKTCLSYIVNSNKKGWVGEWTQENIASKSKWEISRRYINCLFFLFFCQRRFPFLIIKKSNTIHIIVIGKKVFMRQILYFLHHNFVLTLRSRNEASKCRLGTSPFPFSLPEHVHPESLPTSTGSLSYSMSASSVSLGITDWEVLAM